MAARRSGWNGCCASISCSSGFNLSDPAVEEALYDSLAMRGFVDIDLGREPAPDETTVCRFRHLLEAHDLGQKLFDEVQRHLAAKGLKMATGTIVDATIINAPSSPSRQETQPAASFWRSARTPLPPASAVSSPNPILQSTAPPVYHITAADLCTAASQQQSSGELASACTATKAQDAAVQIGSIRSALPQHACCGPQHLQSSAPSRLAIDTADPLRSALLIRLTPKSTRFSDDFVGTLAHWMLAGLSPLHFGCCHEPAYSPSYVGATACPLIPSNARNALNG